MTSEELGIIKAIATVAMEGHDEMPKEWRLLSHEFNDVEPLYRAGYSLEHARALCERIASV